MKTQYLQPQVEEPQTEHPRGISAATAMLPLRIFLGISFIAAGLDKLFDPDFFNPGAVGYIGNQLNSFAKGSPISPLLTFAASQASFFGALVLVSELAIGLGTLLGLFSRAAAIAGAILSLILWLSATWQVAPFFLGSDLPYAIGWLTLAVAGPHPVWSLDARLKGWWEGSVTPQVPAPSRRVSVRWEATRQREVARRRFVTVAGATVITGVATGVAWFNGVANRNISPAGSTLADNSNSASTTTAAASVPSSATEPTSTPVVVGANLPVTTSASAGDTTTAPATRATTAAPTPTLKPTTTAAPTIKGTVLGSINEVPVGQAASFTTPDTGESAILIRSSNTQIKAFSDVCTHEGCQVEYDPNRKYLICPCHGAVFDAQSGNVLRSPARRPLKSFNVQVDGNGNIVYVQR